MGPMTLETRMVWHRFISCVAVLLVVCGGGITANAAESAAQPNIVFILCDDLGYGDVGCYGATKVKTPNIDRLAAGGLRFTDGHCTAGTCTPSRFSVMTGRYAFRQTGTGILTGDARIILDPKSVTLPNLLQRGGYTTGVVGKWHLGLGDGAIDWNGEIKPGPREVGFGYSFIIPATGDRVPCVFIENGIVVGGDPSDPIVVSYRKKVGDEPTGREQPELLRVKPSYGHDSTIVGGISRIGWMSGGKAALWKDEDIADTLNQKAVAFIEGHKEKPFFLYFATHDIHVPRVPHPRHAGSSGCGVRGDVIQQLDGSVGVILTALERLKLVNNTLVIFSSDNGPVVDDGYADGAAKNLNGHVPAGPLRGGKSTVFEGGNRVPFIARWPGRIKPGVSDALVCQIDFLASFAVLTGIALPEDAGGDSLNILPAILGESPTGRDHLIVNDGGGGLAIRKGDWKLIARSGSRGGGVVLFNLAKDLGEKNNVAAENPERVTELAALLQKLRGAGHSR